jgi:hypothetical protein
MRVDKDMKSLLSLLNIAVARMLKGSALAEAS